jgi:hypothetical protein
MADRLEGKPKKKGGWHSPEFKQQFDVKEEATEMGLYEADKKRDMKDYSNKQLLRRL